MPTPNRWLPVVGGVMMNMAFGTFYAISAFMLPLEKEFGWTRAQTSWVPTIGFVMIATWYVIAGRIHDLKGPRLVAAIGGILFSLGLLLASFTQSLSMFYLTAGVIAGTGSGFGYVVPTSVGSKWFPDKRGFIVGLMVGGFGAGSGVFGPIATALISRVGWRATFQIYSLLFFAMTMTATYLVRNPPAGYRPAGWDPSAARGAARGGADVPASVMVRTQTFWALWAAYCLGTTAGTMVISQLVPFARNAGHSAAVAAFALTVGAIGNASGRVLSGWMSDHAGRLNTIRVMLIVQMAAMPALFLLRENVTLFYALLAIVYYCYGTQLSVYASTSADFYGTKNVGFNYGLLLLAWGVASILGPFLGGRVFVATGEYRFAFYTAAAVSVVALAVLFAARNPHAERVSPTVARVAG
ncbi:MAG TPA: OFA family MFS transporter [Vicinamibacterales bacterium]|nr:OFA family MFS transporter [Vicinamibacterales bacterium]